MSVINNIQQLFDQLNWRDNHLGHKQNKRVRNSNDGIRAKTIARESIDN